jgi:uncharacterized protein
VHTPSNDPVTLSRITIFPVKSLDGMNLNSCELLPEGGLRGDREFALVDPNGDFVNAKRHVEIHKIRTTYDLASNVIRLGVEGLDDTLDLFDLNEHNDALAQWLSDYFGFNVRLIRDAKCGFPDDPHRPGPTVVSTATLDTVASWFAEMDLDEARRRFRANLELRCDEAFYEERLIRADGEPVPWRIGDVEIEALQPCVRCVVPGRQSMTGMRNHDFQSVFEARRTATMPESSPRAAFQTPYSLTINTRYSGAIPAAVTVGDSVATGF